MRFPCYIQLDEMDCGPSSLRMIADYYGKHYSLQTLRERCHISREGVSLLGISDAAESIGLRSTGVKISWEQLCNEVKLPCIVYWNQNHFIVVYKIRKIFGTYKVYVSDPAEGLLTYTKEQFCKSWLQSQETDGAAIDEKGPVKYGLSLLLEPTPRFFQEDGEKAKRYNFNFLVRYIRPYTNYFLLLCITMLTTSIIGLFLPFIAQSVVDIGIGTSNKSYVIMLLIAQVVLVMGQMSNNVIRSWLMLHITSRIGISLVSDFLSKLMRLPIAFFDSKKMGDLMQRIDDYNRIQTFLTGSLLSIVTAIISFVVYAIIMAGYNWNILGVFFLGGAIYIGWIVAFMKYRRKLDYIRFQEASANQSNIVQLINGMQEIKLNNCEKQKRWEWERIQVKLFKVSVKSLSLGQIQEIGGTFIDQTKNVAISFIAASAVIDGNMTLGMMMALQYIIGQLNAPLSQFIQFIQTSQDAAISLERIGEIHERADEEPENEYRITAIPQEGDIEFKDVVFQYDGPHSPKVLNHVNLKICANQVTAIVGASGSGKTTMLKLILGFYTPSEGQITLNGIPLSQYSERRWRNSCAVVMQEGYIFSDTIANNISVSEENPNESLIREAVRIANLDEWINELPLRYNTKIGYDGHGLSTGQKQRLLIARAAYKKSRYLLLDEATNSLDANNERVIMENLQSLFKNKTVVVVAHRLSTVKSANNIIVLNEGRIVEQGTHAELIAAKKYYYKLVKNQLELGN